MGYGERILDPGSNADRGLDESDERWGVTGIRNPHRLVQIYLIAGIILSSMLLVVSNGSVLAALVIPVLVLIAVVSFYRLDWGFFILLAVMLVADQFPPRGFESITYQISYFRNLKEIPYIPYFDAGVVNPLELHMIFLILIWVILGIARRRFSFVGAHAWVAALIFFLWFLFGFVWGQSRGGQFLPSLWEMRAMVYFVIFYFFVPQVIKTKRQIEVLVWICAIGITLKAYQGVARYVMLGFNSWGYDELTNSEDPIFMIVIIFLMFGLMLFRSNERQRKAIGWMSVLLFMGIYVGQRRASYASFAVTMFAFVVLLPKNESRRVMKILAVFMVFFTVYLVLAWNNYGRIGMIAQLVKGTFISDPSQISWRDHLSNLYRDYENYNLSITIRHSPFVGIGFGNMYENPISFYGIERMGLLGYIPHNSILWLFAKTGSIGFFLFFFFADVFLFIGASVYTKLDDKYLKAVLAMCLLALINQVVVDFVEMQLTYHRNMVFLGILMGILPTFSRLQSQSRK